MFWELEGRRRSKLQLQCFKCILATVVSQKLYILFTNLVRGAVIALQVEIHLL